MAGDEPEAEKQKVTHSPNFGHELGFDMVDILVGPSKQRFHVHKNILCSKVEYFKKMFEGGFKEGVEQVATLPEDDPHGFALFLEWLYGGVCKPIDLSKHNPPENDLFSHRVGLYCIAEKMCLPDLMNYAITILISGLDQQSLPPSHEAVALAYDKSGPESRIRYLMARITAYAVVSRGAWSEIPTENLAGTMASIPALTHDVVKVLRETEGRAFENAIYLPKCDFHVHKSEQACPFVETIL